jgi:hypothetical protein
MCDKCGVDHDAAEAALDPEVREKYDDLFNRIKEFPSEQRSMLIEEVTTKIKDMLRQAIVEDDQFTVKGLVAAAENSLNLIGLTNATEAKTHEDWTSTGDKRVQALWNDWVELLQTMLNGSVIPVRAEDVPEDVQERFAAGEATEEDVKVLVEAARKAGNDIPEGIEIEFAGRLKNKQDRKVEDVKGTGLYL